MINIIKPTKLSINEEWILGTRFIKTIRNFIIYKHSVENLLRA